MTDQNRKITLLYFSPLSKVLITTFTVTNVIETVAMLVTAIMAPKPPPKKKKKANK